MLSLIFLSNWIFSLFGILANQAVHTSSYSGKPFLALRILVECLNESVLSMVDKYQKMVYKSESAYLMRKIIITNIFHILTRITH